MNHGPDQSPQISRNVEAPGNMLSRLLWNIAGTVSLAVGVVGIVVPVLPTTPFLLIAAACYLRGSKRMYDWMVENRYVGSYLRDYVEGRGVSLRAKAVSVAVLWALILFSALFVTDSEIIRVVLLVVAAAVTVHLLTLKGKA
jgi:uncharacterized membrane protein YbaN (DUF454 family)